MNLVPLQPSKMVVNFYFYSEATNLITIKHHLHYDSMVEKNFVKDSNFDL